MVFVAYYWLQTAFFKLQVTTPLAGMNQLSELQPSFKKKISEIEEMF